MVGEDIAAQVADLPGLAIRHQPLLVGVTLEAVVDEQLLGDVGGILVPAESESLFLELSRTGEDIATALGVGCNTLRRLRVIWRKGLTTTNINGELLQPVLH